MLPPITEEDEEKFNELVEECKKLMRGQKDDTL